jgi:hypothetical protein
MTWIRRLLPYRLGSPDEPVDPVNDRPDHGGMARALEQLSHEQALAVTKFT